ncbi:MAG TPA: DUF58 domain-containing protein [Methylophilaceae bacterium]|jgi:uncharacterized protein (DUF58 family)|nr:DUF58 domain-containing protein [Methylophilaceae bacterium]
MIPVFAKPFHYQIAWRSGSQHMGGHPGLQAGVGLEFKRNVSLIDYPDARRIDVTRTIRDLADQVHVRTFNEKTPVNVCALCDLSASMQFRGRASKMELAAEIAGSIAASAHETGDAFSLVGFNSTVRQEWTTRPSEHMHDAFTLIEKMRAFKPTQAGAQGVLDSLLHLGRQRSLVFLVSDFHMPLALIEKALNLLSRHQVVPVVVWDSGEYRQLPRFGLSTVVDPETGEERTLFFRDTLRRKFIELYESRRETLRALFLKYQSPPCFVEDKFNPAEITAYFQRYARV